MHKFFVSVAQLRGRRFCPLLSRSFSSKSNASFISGNSLLTSEQIELKTHVEKFCKSVIAPLAQSIDEQGSIPRDLWKQLGEQGYLGPTAPTKYGGLGLSYLDHVLIMEQISRASASVGLSYGAHSNLCVNQIARWGTEEQCEQYLPNLTSGEWIGALAISEPSVGSDATSIGCTAEEMDGGFRLNGSKMWITNGPVADVVVVYAKVSPGGALATFIVPTKDLQGFKVAQKLSKIGMRGSETGELVFTDCVIPYSSLLGAVNQGTEVMMSGLDSERLILAAGPLGITQACLDLAVPYVNTRKQFGKFIGDFQLVQAKLASIYSNLLLHRALLYSLAGGFSKGVGDRKDCAAVIHKGSQIATQAALDTIQLLGGNGYISDFPAGRLLCDAKLFEIGAGTTEIRKMLIGRELNEEYRRGEK